MTINEPTLMPNDFDTDFMRENQLEHVKLRINAVYQHEYRMPEPEEIIEENAG